MTISERAERGEDTGVLLDALYDLCPHAWKGGNHGEKFNRLLDINTPEAHLAAAMMLVPEGCRRVEFGTYANGACWAYLCVDDGLGFDCDNGSTEAHALIAAIARTMETNNADR